MKNVILFAVLSFVMSAHAALAENLVSFRDEPKLVLADANRISVYIFDRDSENTSNRKGDCLTVWPPLNVAADAKIAAPFGTIIGSNGLPQLPLKGLPLYNYHEDRAPGDVLGHYPT